MNLNVHTELSVQNWYIKDLLKSNESKTIYMSQVIEKSGAEKVSWDLSDLYTAPDAPELIADKKQVIHLAGVFSETFRGTIQDCSAEHFLKALQQYEAIIDLLYKLGSYAHLIWSTNTEDSNLGRLLQDINELSSEISQKLVFFDIEWLVTSEENAEKLIVDPSLSFYRHHLKSSRKFKPHMLKEEQEQLLTAKSVTGSQAWIRFFDETLGAARFELDGESLTEQEVLSKLHEADRDLRRRASESLTAGFKSMSRTLTFVFNTLLADKYTNDKFRKYPKWISGRNLSNEITDETVDALVDAVTNRYDLVQRYYKLKAKLLGLETFHDYDRYAPLIDSKTIIDWKQAEKMVVKAYSEFHPEMGRITQMFFDNKWIDAAIRPGKQGGAYSASTAVSVHPYVFMNYDGKIRDVQTLAHELGHGVHQYLSRVNGPLQAGTPLTTAETASVFGEMLVFQDLLSELTDKREQLALLLGKIDDTIATVFRQISMNRFEDAIHTARREQGELTTDQFSELWHQTQVSLYGDSVALTENYKLWWSYIPHFLHTPGYVYAYAFGELLVLALYEKYTTQPEGFAGRYLELLSAGGSDSPENLIMKMDVDINSPDFWDKGLQAIEKLIQKAEELSQEIKFS